MFSWLEHVISAFVAVVLFRAWWLNGLFGILSVLGDALRHFPGYKQLIGSVLRGQVQDFTRQIKTVDGCQGGTESGGSVKCLPKQGHYSQVLVENLTI